MTNNNEIIKTSDVARYCNVTPTTVRRWCDKGMLKHIQFPTGAIRFNKSDVEKFLADFTNDIKSA